MTAIIDVETDSTDPNTAKMKFFGGFDCDTGEIVIYENSQPQAIKKYIQSHKILVGFNIKNYDRVVLENYGIDFEYHIILDLWEALAPRGDKGFGEFNKDRLHDINPSLILQNYKLKTIVESLGLDTDGSKGEIDYNIFKKDSWTEEETEEIHRYLKQDLLLEFKLFEWYKNIFSPLKPYITEKDFNNLKHLSCTSGSLAYKVMCYLSGVEEEYNDKETSKILKMESERIEGGHHIHPRWEKVRGNIVCRDFVSHYPTIMIMYNLLKENQVKAVQKVLTERLKAKHSGDKATALALKVPANSIYGILGNPTFKNIYAPRAASETTRIGRELLRRYAMTLELDGFIPLYGFTDSVFVGIPKGLAEEHLDVITSYYIENIKKESPNPIDSFSLGIDKEIKFMWFIEKKDNNYLYITKKDKIEVKGGLFDKNVPKCITKLFDDYISPKILKTLDVFFTEKELMVELKKILQEDLMLSAEEYSTRDLTSYSSKTSLQYQITEKYGVGKHKLIPNIKNIGIGRSKNLKYCSIEDFQSNNLTVDDISFDRMMKYLKPFYTTKEEVYEF